MYIIIKYFWFENLRVEALIEKVYKGEYLFTLVSQYEVGFIFFHDLDVS